MPDASNNADIKALQKEWYKKLRDSGFVDIEQDCNQELSVFHSNKFKFQCSPDKVAETIAYFSAAEQLLTNYDFDNETHKTIWRLHCTGLSQRKIEKAIQKLTPNYKREQIQKIVNFIAQSIL